MNDSSTSLREDNVSVGFMLADARKGDSARLGKLLNLYRNYLTILATTQLDNRLRRRVSPSDLVQETMLGAYRDFPKFRGANEREFLGWLRQILINCLHHAYEMHFQAGRRDIRREVSIDDVTRKFDRSAARLNHGLAAPGTSPSAGFCRRERAVALADQLAKLRSDYREVIVLRNLQGLSFAEVAERMGRKTGAVRMLWLRAMEQLRKVYEPVE